MYRIVFFLTDHALLYFKILIFVLFDIVYLCADIYQLFAEKVKVLINLHLYLIFKGDFVKLIKYLLIIIYTFDFLTRKSWIDWLVDWLADGTIID